MENTINQNLMEVENSERRDIPLELDQDQYPGANGFVYFGEQDASYALLSPQVQAALAEKYINAFEGEPWKEVGIYNPRQLISQYFPGQLNSFKPGVFITQSNPTTGEIVGGCFGGVTTMENLFSNKYRYAPNQPQVPNYLKLKMEEWTPDEQKKYNEIMQKFEASQNKQGLVWQEVLNQTGLDFDSLVFYDDENFIGQDTQGKKLGSQMNQAYYQTLEKYGVTRLLWRTINNPWGALKTRQALELGYSVTRFLVPDDFEVQGNPTPRFVYFAEKSDNPTFTDLVEN